MADKLDYYIYEGPLRAHMEKYFGYFGIRLLVGEHKYVRSPNYKNWIMKHKNFECRPSDVWVVTYPKAGTTWTQEIVWSLLFDFNSNEAKDILMKRFPFFEWDSLMPEDLSLMPPLEDDDPCKPGVTWKLLHDMKDPRTIKSHLHLELLPENIWTSNSKIVYVCRDPRDVCVSYYYHSVKLVGFKGEFSDYVEIFLNEMSFCSPFWKHVLDFWKRRHERNILFIRYEDLQEDTEGQIKKLASFLGKDISDDYLIHLADHVSFPRMKTNPAVNNESIMAVPDERQLNIKFMRNGKVGDWKNHMTSEQLERFKEWTHEALEDSDFPYYRNYE